MPSRDNLAVDPVLDVSDLNPADSSASPQCWVEIDLGALKRNFARLAARLTPTVDVILVVKKDAYGHGHVEVARAMQREERLAAFGVISLEEALALRRAAIDRAILCFSILRGDELRVALEEDIILTVTTEEEARAASEMAASPCG